MAFLERAGDFGGVHDVLFLVDAHGGDGIGRALFIGRETAVFAVSGDTGRTPLGTGGADKDMSVGAMSGYSSHSVL